MSAPAPAADLWERAADPDSVEAMASVTAAEALVRTASRAARDAQWMGDPAPDSELFLRPALDEYVRALEHTPDDIATLAEAGALAERLGDHARARSYITHALAVRPEGPDTPRLLFDLALVDTREGDYTSARDDYLRELLYPIESSERAVVLGNLADTYVSLVDLPHAEEAYTHCVAVSPGYALGWLGLAVTYDRDGRADAAEAARQALHTGADILREINSPYVFFVPEYDRAYYVGMAWEAIARALDASDFIGAQRVVLARESANAAWQTYLRDAPPSDPWRHRVRAHLAAVQPPP